MAGLERVADGVRLRLEATEVEVVTSLAEGLARRAGGHDGAQSDPILDRLAPVASRGDTTADAELRPMLRDELLGLRVTRLQGLVELLGAREPGRETPGFDRVLDRPTAMRIVEALNDLRLALAATVGFDGSARGELRDDDHRADAVRLMDALAWLQGGLIEYVESGPPD